MKFQFFLLFAGRVFETADLTDPLRVHEPPIRACAVIFSSEFFEFSNSALCEGQIIRVAKIFFKRYIFCHHSTFYHISICYKNQLGVIHKSSHTILDNFGHPLLPSSFFLVQRIQYKIFDTLPLWL